MKVENMKSKRTGRAAPNQYHIYDMNEIGAVEYFQSYNSVVVKKQNDSNNIIKIYLDNHTWDYSRTTSKYRNMFLGEDTKTIKAKIKSGEYKLVNLN